jgi:hypothetical protein
MLITLFTGISGERTEPVMSVLGIMSLFEAGIPLFSLDPREITVLKTGVLFLYR